MLPILLIAVVIAVLGLGVLTVFGSKWLLWWHMREIRRMKIGERPGEAIVTYPLA